MGLDERDYLKGEHYPSCTCVACCRKRHEKAAREHWCDRHDRAMGPTGCPLCQAEGLAEESPDSAAGKPPAQATDAKPSETGKPADDDGKTQHGNRLGDTLRGILGKKHGN